MLQGASIHGLRWFRARAGDSYDWPNAPEGRSKDSIFAKARRLYGTGGITRGAYTLRKVCDTTGYSVSQIRRAQKALGQKWKRTGQGGSYLIREEQLDEIAQWLHRDYWCTHLRLYNCIWCATEDRKHYSSGLCTACYERYLRRLVGAGLPRRRGELLALVRKLMRECADLPDGIEKQLVRGRALTKNQLRRLVISGGKMRIELSPDELSLVIRALSEARKMDGEFSAVEQAALRRLAQGLDAKRKEATSVEPATDD